MLLGVRINRRRDPEGVRKRDVDGEVREGTMIMTTRVLPPNAAGLSKPVISFVYVT